MSRPRFLADNDLNEHIIDGVLRRDPLVEFVRAREMGLEDRSDPEVLAFAAAQDLILVSHDVNTMRGFAADRVRAAGSMPGLPLVRQTPVIAPVIESLVLIWSASEAEEYRDQILYLPL